MLEIPTSKEYNDLWIKVETLNDRTKKHTLDIKELEKIVKELNKKMENK